MVIHCLWRGGTRAFITQRRDQLDTIREQLGVAQVCDDGPVWVPKACEHFRHQLARHRALDARERASGAYGTVDGHRTRHGAINDDREPRGRAGFRSFVTIEQSRGEGGRGRVELADGQRAVNIDDRIALEVRAPPSRRARWPSPKDESSRLHPLHRRKR